MSPQQLHDILQAVEKRAIAVATEHFVSIQGKEGVVVVVVVVVEVVVVVVTVKRM